MGTNEVNKVSEYLTDAKKILDDYNDILKCSNSRESRMTLLTIAQMLQRERLGC